MKIVSIYDNNGEFVSYYEGNDSDIEAFIKTFPNFIEGRYDRDAYYYDIKTSVVVNKSVKPSQNHSWNTISKYWELIKSTTDQKIRDIRNRLLSESDWTQMPDVSLSLEQKEAWQTYRQVLRDITETQPDAIGPEEVVWPTPPA